LNWYFETIGTPAFNFGVLCGILLSLVIALYSDYQEFERRAREEESRREPETSTQSAVTTRQPMFSRRVLYALIAFWVVAAVLHNIF